MSSFVPLPCDKIDSFKIWLFMIVTHLLNHSAD